MSARPAGVIAWLLASAIASAPGCGACRWLSDLMAGEQGADIDDPRTIDREGFALEYPGNWTVDTADGDYDPDHMFSIDSAGNCFVQFHIEDGHIEPGFLVDAEVAALGAVMGGERTTGLDAWGRYEGRGKILSGTLVALPSTVRIFAHAGESVTFLVVEQCYDEDLPLARAGFDLVESSFRLK